MKWVIILLLVFFFFLAIVEHCTPNTFESKLKYILKYKKQKKKKKEKIAGEAYSAREQIPTKGTAEAEESSILAAENGSK